MSVQQYEIRFNQLSRFAPILVVTPAERIRRFVSGLKPKIRRDVASIDLLMF